MIIIETCPICGEDLFECLLTSNPPTYQKYCYACGWSWTSKPEEVVRVPFGSRQLTRYVDSYNSNNTTSNFSQSACLNCPSNPKNGGDGICFCTLGQMNIVY